MSLPRIFLAVSVFPSFPFVDCLFPRSRLSFVAARTLSLYGVTFCFTSVAFTVETVVTSPFLVESPILTTKSKRGVWLLLLKIVAIADCVVMFVVIVVVGEDVS